MVIEETSRTYYKRGGHLLAYKDVPKGQEYGTISHCEIEDLHDTKLSAPDVLNFFSSQVTSWLRKELSPERNRPLCFTAIFSRVDRF